MDNQADCCPTPAAPPPTPRAAKGGGGLVAAASGGSIVAAFLATACCVGPLILALLGIGGGAALVALEPYRPYFLTVTFALLGAGFYLTYRKPRLASGGTAATATEASGPACDCPAPRANRAGRILLWTATVAVGGFLVFPYLVPVLFE